MCKQLGLRPTTPTPEYELLRIRQSTLGTVSEERFVAVGDNYLAGDAVWDRMGNPEQYDRNEAVD
jgi:hypothetical protein